jgi:hypothetical protein
MPKSKPPPGPSPLKKELERLIKEAKRKSGLKEKLVVQAYMDAAARWREVTALAPSPDEETNRIIRLRTGAASKDFQAAKEAMDALPPR